MAVDITALKSWLLEKAGPHLADQERQAIESALAKEQVAQVFNEGFAGRSEINRRLDELRAKETALNSELQNHIASLNQWRDGEQSKVNQQVSALQAQYERDVAALRAQVEAEGLQPAVAQPKANAPTANGNGQPKYLSPEDITRMVQAELSKAAYLPAITAQIVEDHRRLYGAVPDMTKVTEQALRTGRSLVDTWREVYKVPEKEHELQEAAIQKRIDDGIAERLSKLQADGAMNQANFSGRPAEQSPIRQMLTAQREASANSPLAIPQPVLQESEAVRAAVNAYNSDRFKVNYPGQA